MIKYTAESSSVSSIDSFLGCLGVVKPNHRSLKRKPCQCNRPIIFASMRSARSTRPTLAADRRNRSSCSSLRFPFLSPTNSVAARLDKGTKLIRSRSRQPLGFQIISTSSSPRTSTIPDSPQPHFLGGAVSNEPSAAPWAYS